MAMRADYRANRDVSKRIKYLLGSSSAVAALLLAAPAFAQDTDANPSATATTSAGFGDIIVTARKRSETAQDTPLAVTAFSPEMIQRRDLSSLEKVAAGTPSLSVTRAASGSNASITIRGVGSNYTSAGIEQSVAVIVDGAYYGQGRVIEEGFFDLARIEVIEGPQALFYGKNATAGVVSIVTADPGNKPEFMARAGYEFQAQQVYGEAVFSGPVTDTFGVRLALRASKMFGGYYDNLATPQTVNLFDIATFTPSTTTALPADNDQPATKELLGRLTLKWSPNSDFTNTLKIMGHTSRGGTPGYAATTICAGPNFFLRPSAACPAPGFHTFQMDVPDNVSSADSYGYGDNPNLRTRYTSYSINNNMSYDIGQVNITSITNFNHFKANQVGSYDWSGSGTAYSNIRTKYRAFSNETRLITDFDGPVNILAGAYYQKTKFNYSQIVLLGGLVNSLAPQNLQGIAFYSDSATKGETLSGYGQVNWKIVPTLELSAGVRYLHETKDSTLVQPHVNPALATFGSALPPVKQKFNNWSPDITLTWRPSSDLNIFGGYKTGYKSGGFSNSAVVSLLDPAGAAATFRPERAKGFEGGIKAMLFDRQLQLALAAYTYKYENLQIDYFNPVQIFYVTTNAGSSRLKGVSLRVDFAPRAVTGLTLRGTVNYNKSRYISFLAPCNTGQSQAEGCNIKGNPSDPLPGFQQIGGATPANAPLWTGTLGASYDVPMGDRFVLNLSVDGRYSSSYNASAFNAAQTRQKSYATLDAGISIRTSDDAFELSLIDKNLTNKFYLVGANEAPQTGSGTGTIAGGTSADYVGYGSLPRTVQVQVTTRF